MTREEEEEEAEAALTRFIHWFVVRGQRWQVSCDFIIWTTPRVQSRSRIKLLPRQTFPSAVPTAAMLQVLSNYTFNVCALKYPLRTLCEIWKNVKTPLKCFNTYR